MSIPEERYVGDLTSGSGEVRDLKRQLDAHIGKGGNAHALATPEEAGFMSQSDKEKLDTVQNGATQNQTDEYLLSLGNANGELPIERVGGLQEEIDRISSDSAVQLREDLARPDLGPAMIGLDSDTDYPEFSVGGYVAPLATRFPSGPTDVFIVYGQSNAKGTAAGTLPRPAITKTARYWSRSSAAFEHMTYDMESTSDYGPLPYSTGHAWGVFSNIYYRETGRNTLWIPGAIGGLTLAELSKGNATGVYDAMVGGFNAAKAEWESAGVQIGTINCVFHQGESDQSSGVAYDDYLAALNLLFDNMIADMGVQRFFLATVGNPQSRPETSWHTIRSAQEAVSNSRADTTVAFTEFKSFTQQNGLLRSDGVHATQRGYNVMGAAMAKSVALNNQQLESVSYTSELLGELSGLQISGTQQPRLMAGVVNLTSAGATLLTRDNNSRFVSSFTTDDLSVSSTTLIIRENGSKNNYAFEANATAVLVEDTNAHLYARCVTGVTSGKFNLQVRLARPASFILNTATGDLRYATSSAPGDLGMFTSADISASLLTEFANVVHNNSESPPAVTRIGSPSVLSDGLSVDYISGTNFRIPRDIGEVLISFPMFSIRPNAIAAGKTLQVSYRAILCDAAL